MIRTRLLVVLTAMLLGGCRDARRDAARDDLQSHPPAGFVVAAIPENLPVRELSPETAELIVPVRYRSLHPTVEVRDGFALPAARAVARRFAELRGWALSALPAGAPLREKLLAAIAAARAPFPVKRVVTPTGAETETLVTLTLRKTAAGWRAVERKADAAVLGAPDDPRIPLEDAPEVAAHVAQLAAVADQLDGERRDFLAARQRAAEQSRARLRALLRTGQTFTALSLRFVVTRGLESSEPAVVVVTVRGAEEATARFSGTLESAASGETVWRAAQVVTLASPPTRELPAVVDAACRPVLVLRAGENQLAGELSVPDEPAVPLTLRPAGAVELLPEVSTQIPDNQ